METMEAAIGIVDTTEAEGDFIATAVGILDTYQKEDAFKAVSDYANAGGNANFMLGGALSTIQKNKWWSEEGYDSFRDCIEQVFGLEYRKAMYLTGIYNDLVELGIPWDEIGHIGWTKLKEIASILTLDNVEDWLEKASTMTALQLNDAVKTFKNGGESAQGDTSDAVSDITTITFKLHPDQKETVRAAIEKAKSEAGTDVDAVAVDAICMAFMESSEVASDQSETEYEEGTLSIDNAEGPVSLTEEEFASAMEQLGAEKVLEVFASLWPEVDVKVTMP